MLPSFKAALASSTVIRVFGLGQLASPKIAEIVGLIGGYHALWIDQEHPGLTISQIEDLSRACRASGIDCFVRLPATDYATVMRVLEAGASGFMASMVRSLKEVEDVVRWARFHPAGSRGVNGGGIDGRYGLLPLSEYCRRANEQVAVGVQIEHQDAVAIVEEIVRVPGLDFLFIGPADLSQSMGFPMDWENPRLWAAIERVAKASQTSGVPWGILPIGAAAAQRCRELGCRIFSLGMDIWAFSRGVRSFASEYPALFQA